MKHRTSWKLSLFRKGRGGLLNSITVFQLRRNQKLKSRQYSRTGGTRVSQSVIVSDFLAKPAQSMPASKIVLAIVLFSSRIYRASFGVITTMLSSAPPFFHPYVQISGFLPYVWISGKFRCRMLLWIHCISPILFLILKNLKL